MALNKQACKNHPQKFTAKRCFYCKAPICQQCHHKHFHHIFCSVKCALKWWAKDLVKILNPKSELIWFILIVLLSNIFMYNLLVNKLAVIPVTKKAQTIVSDSSLIYPAPQGFLIDSIRQAIKGSFNIRMSSSKNMIVSLIQNGRFIETLLPSEKEFSFEAATLKNGKNTFIIRGMTPDGHHVLLDSFSLDYKAPRLDYLMQPVYRVKTAVKKVAFTFDGGSSNRGTQKILDILYKKKIKSTMFLTGRFIENYPGLVKQINDAGHEIGNHTLTHPHFTNIEIDGKNSTREKISEAYFNNQINATDSIYFALMNKHLIPFWRAPFGEINREILLWAAELGYRHIGWSYRCDSWDWVADKNSDLYRSSDQIKGHFLDLEEKRGLNGKIILMHLGSERKADFPYETLAALIDELKRRGYTFVKVSELLTINI